MLRLLAWPVRTLAVITATLMLAQLQYNLTLCVYTHGTLYTNGYSSHYTRQTLMEV